MVTGPGAWARAVVEGPLEFERFALPASLTLQANETRGTSASAPAVMAKARAVKVWVSPVSSETDAGWISMRVSGGEA
jgi:hypothetical protein